MLAIEMKFPVVDFGAVHGKHGAWKARPDPLLEEADHYYTSPDRDFAKTDEALRLRRIGATNIVTYKGPKHAGPTRTRTEIEADLVPGPENAGTFCRLLEHLG